MSSSASKDRFFQVRPDRIPPLPSGTLTIDVNYKALPSAPLEPSPTPEGTIGEAILPPRYADVQHETWAKLCAHQETLLEGRVCDEYRHGLNVLDVDRKRVPRLADLSRNLHRQSGWQVIRVNGFVDPNLFFYLLANKVFPCTDFVRHPDELQYTPAPDMFHDVVGHLPMITNPRFASFFHAFGLVGTRAVTEEQKLWLARVYWFTVEFGLINPTSHAGAGRDSSKAKIYGAGIVSSVGEIQYSLTDEVMKIPFDMETATSTLYDIHHMQEKVFEISSFEQLEESFIQWALRKKLLDPSDFRN